MIPIIRKAMDVCSIPAWPSTDQTTAPSNPHYLVFLELPVHILASLESSKTDSFVHSYLAG